MLKTVGCGCGNKACGDPGREMLYEHALQYFEKEPAFKRAPEGTQCSVCGATDVALWINGTGDAVCRAQMAITSKRVGRKSPDDACVPALDGEKGMDCFTDGHLAVVGPDVSLVVTKVLPTKPLPPSLEVRFPTNGTRAAVLADILRSPPRPPFTVFFFGKKANGPTMGETVDASRIFITDGLDKAGGYAVDREYVLGLLALFDGMKWKRVHEILALRARMATGEDTESDENMYLALKDTHPGIMAEWRRLPSPDSPPARALRTLMNAD